MGSDGGVGRSVDDLGPDAILIIGSVERIGGGNRVSSWLAVVAVVSSSLIEIVWWDVVWNGKE